MAILPGKLEGFTIVQLTDLHLSSAAKPKWLEQPVIFLSHQPEYFRAAREYGIDLQLSGYTHAGQITPFDLFVSLLYHHPYGLYQEGDSYIYTTCGTSVMGVPMRLFSQNEIIKIVLTRKKFEIKWGTRSLGTACVCNKVTYHC